MVALILVRIIMGVAEGPVASTGVAIAVEASKPERRGMNNGIFQCMISLFGLALAPYIATRLLEHYSWHAVFMIVGVPGLIMAVLANGMQLMGVGQAPQQVVKGVVLLLAVAFDIYNRRRAEATR